MNDTLRQALNQIAVRERDLRRATWLSAGWLALAGVGVVMVIHTHRQGEAVSLKAIAFWVLAGAVWFGVVQLVTRRTQSPLAVARRLEARFPDLNARLLTAVEQSADPDTGRLNLFQQQVVAEALDHGRRVRWATVLPAWASVASIWAPRVAIVGLLLVFGLMTTLGPSRSGSSEQPAAVATGDVRVEPGNTSVERNTSLLVLARFGGQLPGDVQLLSKNKAGETKTLAMSKSLDDPVFAARVPDVKEDLQYAVRFGQEQSAWFDAKVFEYPELKRADADLKFPGYTKLADRKAEDVRSITAVEGTSATFTLQLNKPVAEAELRPANGEPIKLQPDPNHPGVVTAQLTLKQSQTVKLKLTDTDGRSNKEPATELAVNVNPNRPPEIKPVTPGRDVEVSPIQELTTGAGVFDDFGLVKVGITYGIAGRPTQDVTLATDAPGGKKIDVRQLLSMEQIQAKPDELLAYHFWAEDYAADGSIRRTAGDMYFAEVRPFEEIFRQGEQPSEGQQRQQQQQQQGGQGQQAEQLADLQKQIIVATWKIIRRETGTSASDGFAPDVKLVRESQASARERAAAMEEELTDARSRGYLKNVLHFMDRAVAGLESAQQTKSPAALQSALGDEQSAYQALLRLRAREFEVTRGNQQQQGSSSSSSSRRQQQLDQMQLNQEENRYQTQRSATPPNENPQQRETRQILNRLKELAQRQEDLNRQMQELKSALEQTRDEKQKEELQRQLARLRDQQEQQLRDTDELRDRMERPENQESMAEARQQLENTRENVRRASEQLQQQQVSDAAASGARAGEQLDQLRDQVGKESAGQLKQAMTDMRQSARDLDDKQKQLSEQLKKLDADQKPSLRQGDQRRDVAEQLDQQKQKLDQLTESMRKTVEESESSQPLVSKQLYDTLRQTSQRQTTETLDASRQLLDRGFTNEARQAEAEAAKGITKLREGVEQAATGVLGDEAEALRRARAELDRLTDDLQREVDRNNPGGRTAAATRPAGRGLATGASTRPADGQLASNATTRPSGQAERGDGRQASTQPASTRPAGQLALADPGERAQSPSSDQQPGRQGETNPNANDNPSSQRQNASGNPEQNQSGQPNRQSGERGNNNASGNRPEDPANPNGQSPQTGQSGNETQREPGNRQSNAGQQPGQRESTGQRQSSQSGARSQPQPNQPGQQPGQGQPSAEGQPTGEGPQPGQSQQPGEGQQSGQAQQPGEGQQAGQGQQPGGDARQPSQNANNQPRQPGLRGQTGQGQGRGIAPGEQPQDDSQPRRGRPNDSRENDNQGRGGSGSTNTTGREDAFTSDNDNPANGPLTGDNFQAWSDRLRDVEEMVTDPKLRQRAASIRERARELRAEMKRHSKQPNWDVVQNTVGTPLAELRDEVALELLRKQSPDALVPLDKDNVPPQYAEQVKRYYERLGAGR